MLKQMYSRMLRSRTLADSFLAGRARTRSEGVTVGIAMELRPGDMLSASRRQLMQYICSIADGAGQYSTWIDLIVGHSHAAPPLRIPVDGPGLIFPDSDGRAQISVAIGAAHTFRTLGQSSVSVILAGDQASGLLSAYEAARFAGEAKLPVVFAFESDLNPHAADHHHPMLRAEDFGFPRIPVDGNDSVAVHRVATEAIQRARQGDGPTLIECQMTKASAGANSLGLAEDPVQHMRQYLQKHQLWSDAWSTNLQTEVQTLRDQLIKKQRE
jgi:2-oxoisovalerate dehydrogenase E1 component alpha subunit